MLKYLFFTAGLLSLAVTAAQGSCQRGDCFQGKGSLRFTDGTFYRGDFVAGKFEGNGTISYPDGSSYTGDFRQQLQDGRGILTDGAGNSYSGRWRQGKRHGRGTIVYTDGSTLVGNWSQDSLSGDASMKYSNGDYYEGQIKDYLKSGHGTMRYASGPSVSGNWKRDALEIDWNDLGYEDPDRQLIDCNEGCPDGPGRFTYSDGTVATGMLVNGTPNGRSTITFASGDVYRGNFIDHRPEGIGTMYYADGRSIGGIWQRGGLYRELMSTAPVADKGEAPFDEEVKVWAVVVGCAFYQHMKTLRYTDDDAYQVYAFLKSIEGGALADDQVKVLIDENATRENILAAMAETYRQADENDLILFYFSGHGLPGAFLPIDYDGQTNALRHDDVRAALARTRSRHKLVIADACHSGSLASRGVEGDRAALNSYYSALTKVDASTALMMSSKGEEISLEDGGLRSGVFSHYLIRGLKGEADVNRDALVSVRELFDYVYREVRGYTGNVQTPTMSGNYDEEMPISVVRTK